MWNFGKASKDNQAGSDRLHRTADFMAAAVKQSSVAIVTVDRDLRVTYANPQMLALLKTHADDFRTRHEGFSAERVVGVNLDSLHDNGEDVRRLISDTSNLPCQTEVSVGAKKFRLNVAAVRDAVGSLIGYAIEWIYSKDADLAMNFGVIDRVLYVIEFHPDATVITANENFLKLFGYKLEDVVGKHNDIFIDDVTKATEEYRELWTGLARGESHEIKTKVVASDGSDMWLSVSYNAVTNEDGKTVKIVAIVTDITDTEVEINEMKAKLAALDRSQGVIEFELDGTIIGANENFLKVVGYEKDEIVGKHHAMFVEPAFAESEEYRQHWNKIRNGEVVAGKFERIGKGGRKVWIEASYNPIFNLDGHPYKAVKFATDITAIENERREVEAERAQKAAELSRVVAALEEHLHELSSGDLQRQMNETFPEEYETLRRDFNATSERLKDTMRSVTSSAATISNGAQEISKAADDLSHRTEQQAASLEETAAALEEITATVKKTADNAKNASTIVSTAKTAAEEGGRVVESVIAAMSNIEQSSKQITDIIGVIDEIAFQTNLLALNAGVEAARAGDAGRGFAVVASEVRALAQRSSEASREIKSLIKTSSEHVGSGVKLVGESGDALKRIVEQVVEINTLVTEMAQAAQQQSTGIEEVNAAVAQMDQVTQQNAAMVEESTAASRSLAEETNELSDLVGFFKVGDGAVAKKPAVRKSEPAPVAAKPAAPPKPAAKPQPAKPQQVKPQPAKPQPAKPENEAKPAAEAPQKSPPKPEQKSEPKEAAKPAPKAAERSLSGPAATAKRIVGGLSAAGEDDWEEF